MREKQVEAEVSVFENDMIAGLSQQPKRTFSKYFYDDKGSEIFVEIMKMPSYYLTNAEHTILNSKGNEILQNIEGQQKFRVIELGAGDGAKTKELLKFFISQHLDITYHPVDISQRAMDLLKADITSSIPQLKIEPLVGDYFEVLSRLETSEQPSLFLFLGSNIGNYENAKAKELLRLFQSYMNRGDYLLTGFDLRKHPKTILAAYNDEAGITKRFNLNLLSRMNRELETNFDLAAFDFYPYYDALRGEVRSCLVSLKEQSVYFPTSDRSFLLKKDELIFTELSKKFSLSEIEDLSNNCGFTSIAHIMDENSLFSDSLWRK